MAVSADAADVTPDREPAESEPGATRRRGILFWIRRYLPAEIVGTLSMLAAGSVVGVWIDAPPAVAIAAVIGESVGFYLVLGITVYVEQAHRGGSVGRTTARTVLLLVAEFGPAELLDTLLVRPAAVLVGVVLVPDPLWGMLAGKLVADLLFYAVAGGAFTITARTGLRDGRRTGPSA